MQYQDTTQWSWKYFGWFILGFTGLLLVCAFIGNFVATVSDKPGRVESKYQNDYEHRYDNQIPTQKEIDDYRKSQYEESLKEDEQRRYNEWFDATHQGQLP